MIEYTPLRRGDKPQAGICKGSHLKTAGLAFITDLGSN